MISDGCGSGGGDGGGGGGKDGRLGLCFAGHLGRSGRTTERRSSGRNSSAYTRACVRYGFLLMCGFVFFFIARPKQVLHQEKMLEK